jgi:hypothetical protein
LQVVLPKDGPCGVGSISANTGADEILIIATARSMASTGTFVAYLLGHGLEVAPTPKSQHLAPV